MKLTLQAPSWERTLHETARHGGNDRRTRAGRNRPPYRPESTLARFDAVVLNNTTGGFLDDPDPERTRRRRDALLAYVRSGHGLVLLHAATDAYRKDAAVRPDQRDVRRQAFRHP